MKRATISLAVLALLAAGVGLGTAASGRAAGIPCGILAPCTTTTTTPTPTTPTTTPTTPTPTTPTPTPARPHGRFDGEIGRYGRTTVETNASGTQAIVFGAGFTGDGRCNDGERFTDNNYISYDTAKRRKAFGSPPAIDTGEDARFDRTINGIEYRHRKPVKGKETFAMTAHFTATSVTGTIHDVFSGHGFHCDSGTIRYTAYHDGTPQAPEKTATIETGTYSGTGTKVAVFLPLHVVTSLSFPATFHCGGNTNTQTVKVGELAIAGAGFHYTYSGPYSDPKYDASGHYTVNVTGRFSHRGGVYTVSLQYRESQHATAHGQPFSCTGSYSGNAYGP